MSLFLFTVTPPEIPSDGISFATALMILLGGGVLYCLKAVGDLRRQFDRRDAPAPSSSKLSPPSPTVDSVSPEVIAVSAAAIHVALGPGHRVLAIAPAPLSGGDRWSVEGRREVFHSHQFR